MAAATGLAPPLTGSALIKALKAAQDPPVPGGPSKVDIATAAWADSALIVPRKADVIRDWILEAWSRSKAGFVCHTALEEMLTGRPRNPIAQAAYHDLLVAVTRECASAPSAPLALLGNYIASAHAGADELGVAAAPSLRLLFAADAGVKAEAWAEMLGKLVSALEGGPWSALRPAAEIVCEGLAASLPTSPNAKKVS